MFGNSFTLIAVGIVCCCSNFALLFAGLFFVLLAESSRLNVHRFHSSFDELDNTFKNIFYTVQPARLHHVESYDAICGIQSFIANIFI